MGVLDEAVAVWHAARVADGKEPDGERIRRVRQKLEDPDALLVVVERAGSVVAMALAEPFRERDGAGPVVEGRGHVSMVFVHPGSQGQGVGRELMTRLVAEAPWSRLSLWTRDENMRARRLYAAVGFTESADAGSTPHGDPIHRWER